MVDNVAPNSTTSDNMLDIVLEEIQSAYARYAEYKTSGGCAETLQDAVQLYRNAVIMLCNLGTQTANNLLRKVRLELTAALAESMANFHDSSLLDEQFQLCQEGLLGLTPSDPLYCAFWHWRGTNLCRRYETSGNAVEIEESVSTLRHARRHYKQGHITLSAILSELGFSLVRQFQHAGSRADLTEALALHSQALESCPRDDPEYCRRLINLAHGLFNSSAATGSSHDLHESVRVYRAALEMCPPGHRDRAKALGWITTSYWMVYEQSNALQDLEDAISCGHEAMEISGDLLKYGTNLATILQRRFSRLGHVEDLESSVALNRRTLEATPPNHRFANYVISNLSSTLRSLYLLKGDIAVLEEAIKLQRRGIDLCTPGDPQRSVPLNNLAKLLVIRFRQTRDSADLEEAISLWREALALETTGRRHHSEALCQLAEGLMLSFESFDHEGDLHEAISLHGQLAKEGNANDHRQSDFVIAAANALRIRFENIGDDRDLEAAVERYRACLGLRPGGHPDRHKALHSLASALQLSFQVSDAPSDHNIETALSLQEEAVGLLPSSHPDCALLLCGLARIYLTPGSVIFSISAAIDALSDAIVDSGSSAHTRIGEAAEVLQILDERIAQYPPGFNPYHKRLLDLHIAAIRLLPAIANFGLDIRSRLRLLERAEQISARAARLALIVSEAPLALEVLEEGRAVFWAQYLRLRSAFDALPKDLSEELDMVANQLEASGDNVTTLPASAGERSALEDQATQRRTLSNKFETLIKQARALPGFDRFLLPASYVTLAQAVCRGILVTLIPGETISYAIVMQNLDNGPTTVDAIQLSISDRRLSVLGNVLQGSNYLQRKRLRSVSPPLRAVQRSKGPKLGSKQVLSELWAMIAQPIIEKLHLQRYHGRMRPRLWWCPTGVFAFLPVHAASIFLDHGVHGWSDYAVSSYTPTIGALVAARKRPLSCSTGLASAKILLAGVPRPFEGENLSDVVKEAKAIKAIVPSSNFIPLPRDSDCSIDPNSSAGVDDVVSRLPDASILHLACHGFQDSTNALDSGFAMRDRMLTVAHLMSLKLPRAYFAFLSACETAKGDERQPDQAVHLAAAMLFVGFRSVVGTMWSMGDVDGPMVAQTVYQQVFSKKASLIDPDSIPYALEDAMSHLRLRGLHPSRWASYIHLGI